MRIVVTGSRGRLGAWLCDQFAARGDDVVGLDRHNVDLTDAKATRRLIVDAAPDVVLHTAAWTDVDGCAREPERAVLHNGLAAGHVAQAALAASARIISVSTNEVFDGTATAPYREFDRAAPANAYGYSKWVGEELTRAANPDHTIVRTSWLFANEGKSFPAAILAAATSGRPLRVVTDETASPTYAPDLADALVLLTQIPVTGTLHFVNEGICSRFELARTLLDQAGLGDVPIEAILSTDWPRPSTPPRYSPLTNQIGTLVGIRLRSWKEAISAYVAFQRKPGGHLA
jgi:dTDP-4-dehydrorhamnose reductase